MATWNNSSRNSATFSNATRNSASFSNASRNTAVFSASSRSGAAFTNASKSLRLFGDFTFDEIGALTFDDLFYGRPVGDWEFDDLVGGLWQNQTRN